MKGCIYKATNHKNRKCYVGQTTWDLKTRIRGHMQRVRNGSMSAFHCAIRKYGIETFSFVIIDQAANHSTLDISIKELWRQHAAC